MMCVILAIYRLLLALTPPGFRRAYGRDAAVTFERQLRDAHGRGGWSAATPVALRGVWGAVRAASAEWRDLLGRPAAWTGLGMDLRLATRALGRRPAASLTVIATVTLAVGATTSAFSVVEGVLLRPLPYPQPDRLVRVWQTRPDWLAAPLESMRSIALRFQPHAPTLREWTEFDTGFETLGGYVDASFVLQRPAGAEVVRGQEATSGLFEALGIAPLQGRPLRPEDAAPDSPRVVLLSEAMWRDEFGSSPDVIGTALALNGSPHTVVGVMPAGFEAPRIGLFDALLPGDVPRLWTALTEEAWVGNKNVSVIARLEPGVDLETAAERLSAVDRGLAATGTDSATRGVRVEILLDSVVGDVRRSLWFLFGAVGLVLLVAMANIANVLTALGLSRRQDLAVRAALGAPPLRLARTLFAESVLLAALGGLGGLVLAWAARPVLLRVLPPSLPRQDWIGMGGGVLAGGVLLTGLTAVVVGTWPALLAARSDPQSALRAPGRGSTAGRRTTRLRSALVAAEVAVACTLMVAAGLLANSFSRLQGVERGFETEGLAALWIRPDPAIRGSPTGEEEFQARLEEELERIPGVQATIANSLPLSGLSSATGITVRRPDRDPLEVSALLGVVRPDFHETVGIPILQGRAFGPLDDRDSEPVAIINAVAAREFWPDQSPLGQRLGVDGARGIMVVGVAADVRHQGLALPVEPTVYVPAAQTDRVTWEWILRVSGNPADVARAAREAVARISPETPVTRVLILDDAVARSVALPRFRTLFVLGLAGLAALLALLGVYATLTHSVTARLKEIGVRMALGAARGRVTRDVVASGLRLVLGGAAAGVAMSLAGARVLQGFLFDLSPVDPATYGGIVLLVLLVGTAAAYVPARRAASVDPVSVLNAE